MKTDFPDLNEPDTGMALLSAMLLESIAASFTRPGTERSKAFDRFRGTFNRVFDSHEQLPTSATLRDLHTGLAQTDLDRLGQRSRQQVGKSNKPSEEMKKAWKLLLKAAPTLDTLTNLDELIRTSSSRNSSAWELYFSTRPLGAVEVNLLDPQSQTSVKRMYKWLRALRGNLSLPPSDAPVPESEITEIKWAESPAKPLIAITSYLTELRSWKSRVKGKSDLSVERFNKLLKLVRETSQLRPRPHYVVFPELSIPREWLMEVASALQRSRISLIAGVEYEISLTPGRRVCHNSAFLFLRSTDLGYSTYRLIRQDKTFPALEEERDLQEISNLKLVPKTPYDFGFSKNNAPRPVFKHGQFHFGILICNELTNIEFRSQFRGKVDALFVLEWNKDLKTFAPLVEAAASDVHCYVVQVNNRMYGDSRIRVPAKDDWNRDLVRVQGGVNDYLVVGEVDFQSLRKFQSQYRSPTDKGVLFKPVPTGFVISASRNQNATLDGQE